MFNLQKEETYWDFDKMVSYRLKRIFLLTAYSAKKLAAVRNKKLKLITTLEEELKIADSMARNISSRNDISGTSSARLRMRLDQIKSKITGIKKEL